MSTNKKLLNQVEISNFNRTKISGLPNLELNPVIFLNCIMLDYPLN